ncbi:hypothetical protein PYW07_009415 [Mythimna separata]|uniref:Peptidase S1 domain-containing protein n=1 Tax=Mythimna separata TaxID=271217 RepID=A0AAD7YBY3_MYTSE|nr:hypothetical protein PYW07_009415 [Mythimna separata]
MLVLLFVLCAFGVSGKINEDFDQGSSGDHDLEDSLERIGPTVTQVYEYPFAASLNKNGSYVCSAVVLNAYWLLTLSKCFDSSIITSYVTHKNLGNFTVRVGSSYNNKAGVLFKIKMLINNFDLHVTAVKLETPIEYTSQVQSVRLPGAEDNITLGFLASIVAWTPNGHMRVVNSPMIDPAICEVDTKMLPGQYVCVGGVQDPNRHFCRRDNGGAVIQNNTLVAISSFINPCAQYTRTHAFPKITSFIRWLDSVIWDEDTRPSTTDAPTTTASTTTASTSSKMPPNVTEKKKEPEIIPYYGDVSKYMLTLPYDPVNVPLEPAEDNSVLPGMSLYESYLQSLARAKTSTTEATAKVENKTESTPSSTAPVIVSQHIYARMPRKYDRVWY